MIALVTGATAGIGSHTARALAGQGMRVIVAAILTFARKARRGGHCLMPTKDNIVDDEPAPVREWLPVLDDDPAPVREWLPVLAGALGAKPPSVPTLAGAVGSR